MSSNIEPVWTYQTKLQNLDSKIDAVKKELRKEISNDHENSLRVIASMKKDIVADVNLKIEDLKVFKHLLNEDLKESLNSSSKECKKVIENFKSTSAHEIELFKTQYNNLKKEISDIQKPLLSKIDDSLKDFKSELNEYDKEHNNKITQIFNSLEAANKKLDRIEFDIIDNENNISITYVNPLGKLEYAALDKCLPDNKTIIRTKDKKLAFKYTFNDIDFGIKNNTELYVNGMTLSSGKHMTSDFISDSLSKVSSNINDLKVKINQATQRLKSIDGYSMSHNFYKSFPDQEELNEFALKSILGETANLDGLNPRNIIPNGTKIKNLFDNHIWVCNHMIVQGLSSLKWEDFGSDNICIASNDGTLGLVTGSNVKYKGTINTNGTISINGLEEEMHSILQNLSEISSNLLNYKQEIDAKLYIIDSKIQRLEGMNG